MIRYEIQAVIPPCPPGVAPAIQAECVQTNEGRPQFRAEEASSSPARQLFSPYSLFAGPSCIACHAAYFFALRSFESSRFRWVRSIRCGQWDGRWGWGWVRNSEQSPVRLCRLLVKQGHMSTRGSSFRGARGMDRTMGFAGWSQID